jgi:hypothetical protein
LPENVDRKADIDRKGRSHTVTPRCSDPDAKERRKATNTTEDG